MGSPSPVSTDAISLPRTCRRCFLYGKAADILFASNAAETMFASPVVAPTYSQPKCDRPLLQFTWTDQKLSYRGCDFVAVCLQRKVAGIQEAHIGVRHVAFERLSTSWQEEGIVLPPHRQKRRFVFAEKTLEIGI